MPSKMGIETNIQPIVDIEGVPVELLIKKYGTPLFVISEKQTRLNIAQAKHAFTTSYPKVKFAWSYKTNYINKVCNIFHKEGSLAEVVSIFELKKALNNGIEGHNIIFNGPNKSDAELEFAVKHHVTIHIDNYDELFTLEQIASKQGVTVNVAIRVNMKTCNHGEWERFGFNLENGEALNACKCITKTSSLKLVGIHCHIGTYITMMQPYMIAAKKMANLAVQIREQLNHVIEYIDMGGGFASQNTLKSQYDTGNNQIPQFKDYANCITNELYNADFSEQNRPTLILETGRALIDNTTTLLTTVLSTKRLQSGKRNITINAGVNVLFTSFWYNHEIVPTKSDSSFMECASVYGPLCMNIDCIRENVLLPNVSKGDHLAVKNVGAYNMTQWMQFINLRPSIVMIKEDGTIDLVKEKDKEEDIAY